MTEVSLKTPHVDVTIREEGDDIEDLAFALACLIEKCDYGAMPVISRVVELLWDWDDIEAADGTPEHRFVVAAVDIGEAREKARKQFLGEAEDATA